MKSIEEYEAYLDEFRKMPNASVCEEGDYLALFDTSDGIKVKINPDHFNG